MFGLFKGSKSVPFEEQLAVLAEAGIALKPGIGRDRLFARGTVEQFEKSPYLRLLIALGGEPEWGSPFQDEGYPSDGIWHFDTECIEDDGAYVRIAERMSELAQGDLPLDEIGDHVDIEGGEARLWFTLDGARHEWEAEISDDWVDPTILSRFAALLTARSTGRRFYTIDLGGQDCLIGCATEAQAKHLASATGLRPQWID